MKRHQLVTLWLAISFSILLTHHATAQCVANLPEGAVASKRIDIPMQRMCEISLSGVPEVIGARSLGRARGDSCRNRDNKRLTDKQVDDLLATGGPGVVAAIARWPLGDPGCLKGRPRISKNSSPQSDSGHRPLDERGAGDVSEALGSSQPTGESQGIPTGTFPQEWVLVGLNGDNLQDVAIVNERSGEVTLILGQPGNTYTSQTFPVGMNPSDIDHSDFNNDGNQDLIVANGGAFQDGGELALLIGNGDGTVQPAVSLAPGPVYLAVSASDFNTDGNADFAAVRLNEAATVHMGNGDGTFQDPVALTLAFAVTTGDFNNDNRYDIVVAGGDQSGLQMLPGNGDGTFGDAIVSPLLFDAAPFQLEPVDFNRDGNVDIISNIPINTAMTVSLGNGDGTFQPPHFYGTGDFNEHFGVGDLDLDGHQDVLVSNADSDHDLWLMANGDGTFGGARGYRSGTRQRTGPRSLAPADYNRDGLYDLTVGSSGDVTYLQGLPGGGFAEPIAIGAQSNFVVSDDFNRDGFADVAFSGRVVQVLNGNGDGTFTEGFSHNFGFDPRREGMIVAADLDRDTFKELLFLDRRQGTLFMFAGNGDGTFGDPTSMEVGPNPLGIEVADLNNDDDLDLGIAVQGDFRELNGNFSVLLGNGDGSFQDATMLQTESEVNVFTFGDLNHDNILDLALLFEQPEFTFNASIFMGRGDGTFGEGQPLPGNAFTFFTVSSLAITDYTMDGNADLIASATDLAQLLVFPGSGDGMLGDPVSFDFGDARNGMQIVDLNFDGKNDVVAGNSEDLVFVHFNGSSLRDAGSDLLVSSPGAAVATTSRQGPVQTGYATVTNAYGPQPVGTAVFEFRPAGVTIAQTAVPASPVTLSSRFLVDQRASVSPAGGSGVSVRTGMAIVNLGAASANVTYTMRDTSGGTLATGTGPLGGGQHASFFVDELANFSDFVFPPGFDGIASMEVESDQPLAIVALRLAINQRGEALLTSTPVADGSDEIVSETLSFAQFADGGGAASSIVLLNTSTSTQTGTLWLFDNNGDPLPVGRRSAGSNTSFDYSIPPGGAWVFESDGTSNPPQVGWAQAVPNSGSTSPVGAGLFEISQNGILVSQSGVPTAQATRRARIYVDTSAGRDAGVAIANPGGSGIQVSLSAFGLEGAAPAGASARISGQLTLGANGHDSQFATQLIPTLPAGFEGVVDLTSDSAFIALTVTSLTNERGEFLFTTFPTADLNRDSKGNLIFPQIGNGGGFRSQFILIGRDLPGGVELNLYGDDGRPLTLFR